MRVYKIVDIMNGRVPFEKKMDSSRGFVISSPEKLDMMKIFDTWNGHKELPVTVDKIAVYVFDVLSGPVFYKGVFRYRVRMLYELLSPIV